MAKRGRPSVTVAMHVFSGEEEDIQDYVNLKGQFNSLCVVVDAITLNLFQTLHVLDTL